MTSITALNVRLGMDASQFSQGANLARAEVNRVAAIMRQSVPPAEKYKQELDLLNRAFSEAGKTSKEYANALDFLAKKHGQVAAEAQATTTKFSALSGNLKSLVAGYVGLNTVTKSIRMAANAEMTAKSFEVLIGSLEGATFLLNEIRALDTRTQLSLGGLQSAAQTMMAFNVPASEVIENLKMLSDVSMGNQQRFEMLTLAFAQASAAGKMTGQDLLQMVNAGFNPLQEISKRTGESMEQLRKRMEQGQIAIGEVKQAFVDATSEGGKFFGMSDQLAETMGGKMAVAASQLDQAYIKLGQSTQMFTITLLDGFDQGISVIDRMTNALEKMFDGFAFGIAQVQDFVGAQKAILTMDMDYFNRLANGEGAVTKFLDLLDARDKERAQLKEMRASADSLNAASAARLQVVEATAKAEQEVNKTLEKQKTLADDLGKKFAEVDERVRKRAEERQREFDADLAKSLDDARSFFENEQRRMDRIQADASESPRSIEAGSSEAAAFIAAEANRLIGASVQLDRPTAGDREIVEKAEQLYQEMQIQRQQNASQEQILREMLAVQKENGFRRIR